MEKVYWLRKKKSFLRSRCKISIKNCLNELELKNRIFSYLVDRLGYQEKIFELITGHSVVKYGSRGWVFHIFPSILSHHDSRTDSFLHNYVDKTRIVVSWDHTAKSLSQISFWSCTVIQKLRILFSNVGKENIYYAYKGSHLILRSYRRVA